MSFTGMHIVFGVGGGRAGKEQMFSSSSGTGVYSASVVQLYSVLQSRSQETQVGAPSTNAQVVLLASVHVVAGGGVAVELVKLGQAGRNPCVKL